MHQVVGGGRRPIAGDRAGPLSEVQSAPSRPGLATLESRFENPSHRLIHRALQGEQARDLDRWRERGLEGLADGAAPGNPPRITQEARRYMEERLTEERTWNAMQLAEVLKEEFALVVTPEAVRQHLQSMGYSWKRTRYVPNKEPDPDEEREAREELEALKRGGRRRDRREVSRPERLLVVPTSHEHLEKKGQAHQHRVKGRWGSEGRLNLMGTLRVEGEGHEERLEYRMLEGSCDSGEVLLYLDALAEKAQREDESCVVVLDNAPFHTAGVVGEREEEWEARGLVLSGYRPTART